MQKTTLHQNEWISLMKIRDLKKGVKGYIFAHETRCDGRVVAIVPFRYDKNSLSKNKVEILLRDEMTPCWSMEESFLCSITGGVDKGETPTETAVHEMLEETGYRVKEKDFIHLGHCFASKHDDTIYDLFTIDLSGLPQEELSDEGSFIDKQATAKWMPFDSKVYQSKDPLVGTIISRALPFIKDYE